uniref:Macaca fascicularis brain cDNA clone: QflA-19840, similar to human solute carrier family 35, member A4 (SLC35A4), mRNA, RefSeq: NM_080670.2 n=1 Tax=Macaca fascicularis TaxID=9541 RepID=I7G6E0_MACFA|nr:unnamed protein product [Macaca fascicularis]
MDRSLAVPPAFPTYCLLCKILVEVDVSYWFRFHLSVPSWPSFEFCAFQCFSSIATAISGSFYRKRSFWLTPSPPNSQLLMELSKGWG